MPIIFLDPVGWARQSVGTLRRLILVSGSFIGMSLWLGMKDKLLELRCLTGFLLFNLLLCFYAMWRMLAARGALIDDDKAR